MRRFLSSLKHASRRTKILISLGNLAILCAILVIVFAPITSRNQFCSTCHEMTPYIKSFNQSSHAKIKCIDCHSAVGIVGVALRIESIREFFSHIIGSFPAAMNVKSELAQTFEDDICIKCHNVSGRTVSPPKGIIINHKKHQKKKIACTTCHNRVAHPSIKKYLGERDEKPAAPELEILADLKSGSRYPDHMKMRYCMTCHTGRRGKNQASSKCETCHTRKLIGPPSNHKLTTFSPKIREVTFDITRAEMEITIEGSRSLHSAMAMIDSKYCYSCHQKDFCNGCHGLDIPHPRDWKSRHGKSWRSNSESCIKCHGGKQNCSGCHHQREMKKAYDKNNFIYNSLVSWRRQHPDAVKQVGAAKCFKCHDPTFCSDCHMTGESNIGS